MFLFFFFFFQAEDGIRDFHVTGVQTCALPISVRRFIAPDIYAMRDLSNAKAEQPAESAWRRPARARTERAFASAAVMAVRVAAMTTLAQDYAIRHCHDLPPTSGCARLEPRTSASTRRCLDIDATQLSRHGSRSDHVPWQALRQNGGHHLTMPVRADRR